MNLATIASSHASPESLHSFRTTTFLSAADYGSLEKILRLRTRASVTLTPVTCFASSSFSSSPPPSPPPPSPTSSSCQPKEVPGAARTTLAPLRRPEKPPPSSPSSSSNRLANFKPPPPARPVNPEDLARDLPFQYWYSYADLPAGIPKRRPKSPLSPTSKGRSKSPLSPNSESGKKRDGVERGRTGANGTLWEAVLAAGAESNSGKPKVRRKGRGRGGGNDGGGGSLRTTVEEGLLSTDYDKRLTGCSAAEAPLEDSGKRTLSEQEKRNLIGSCHGTGSQINMGWEGWNSNYVSLVHSYWKRSRICKIKCKGVVTLDLDSVCRMIEVETGGSVIGRVGGTVYLFRGWDFDYWRDAQRPTVGEPRIIRRFPKKLPVPDNLTEDVKVLRARGRELPALCKPGKHGVYLTLLRDVRAAFEMQDLVRVNCQGFHSKNLKLLGNRLQALVPCELISFEFEHILMWRSKDVNSPTEAVVLNQSEESCLVSEAVS